MRPRLLLPLLALVVATTGLAGCGSGGAPDGPTTGAPPSATLGTTLSPTPSPVPSTAPPTRSGGPVSGTTEPQLDDDLALPPNGKPVRATGSVTEGVEAGCLLMQVGGTSYQLLGVPGELLGQVVTVTGRLAADTLTTCQQGKPLKVDSYEVVPTTQEPSATS